MTGVHVALGVALIVLNLVAGAWGAWAWYRVEPAPGFWPLLRTGQAVVAVQVLFGGVLYLTDHRPNGDLHILYGALPVAVMYIAEQLRVASAEAVLEARGLENAEAVGGAAGGRPALGGAADRPPRDGDHGRERAGDRGAGAAGGDDGVRARTPASEGASSAVAEPF